MIVLRALSNNQVPIWFLSFLCVDEYSRLASALRWRRGALWAPAGPLPCVPVRRGGGVRCAVVESGLWKLKSGDWPPPTEEKWAE